ncbi:MAG: sigma-70 family RNA polymerase sigma factor [Clostridia bacterium]|nr:sigma-70 family RNA polymerase sigma factor [Clostridia bacterium]
MYKNKNFDYDLWTTNDYGIKRYWVRIRATQEVVEVDLKTLRFLRAEEKKIYRAIEDARNNAGTVLSYDVFEDEEVSGEWLIDEKDLETHILMQLEIDAVVKTLTPKQFLVYKNCILEGMELREFARKNNLSYSTVKEIRDAIRKKFQKNFN